MCSCYARKLFNDANCIAAQTKGYLAANTKEFCYLIKLLFDCGQHIDIVTEDDVYHIDTVNDADQQRAALHKIKKTPNWHMQKIYSEMLTTTLIQMHPTCTQIAP